MDQNFLCFIEMDGHKYDILLDEVSVYFIDIYNKIQQIIKLSLNKHILFETHIFEIFDYNSSEGVLIQAFNSVVNSLSTIRIEPNPVVNENANTSPPELHQMSVRESKKFKQLVRKMMDEEEDIKMFNLIVQLVKESKLVYKKCATKKWKRISQILSGYGFNPKIYSTSYCRENFFNWARWYALFFSKLNGCLESKEQEIFDLLKIVHILDFNKFWSNTHTIHSLLKKISHKSDIKLVLKPTKSEEENDCHNPSSKSDIFADKDSKAVNFDPNVIVFKVTDNIKANESVVQTTPLKDNSIQKAVPPTDPRLTVKCDANNDLFVIPVQTKPLLKTSIKQNQSISSKGVSHLKPSIPCKVDPRLQPKSDSNPKIMSSHSDNQIKEKEIKGKQITLKCRSAQPAQPSTSMRETRLERRLRDQEMMGFSHNNCLNRKLVIYSDAD